MTAAGDSPDRVGWNFHAPPATDALCAELSAFRGRELWAEGRRPHFLRDGRPRDDQPADAVSHHVVARRRGEIVGCIRATPLSHPASEVAPLLRAAAGNPVLDGVCYEVGRWIVGADHRRGTVGMKLVAGIWATCRLQGWDWVVCTAGTKDRQADLLERTGARPLPGVGEKWSAEYDDMLRVLYFRVLDSPPMLEKAITAFMRRA